MTAPSVAAERKDAALLAFAVVIRTLTEASKERPGEAGDVLLELAEAIGNMGEGVADMLASQPLVGKMQ